MGQTLTFERCNVKAFHRKVGANLTKLTMVSELTPKLANDLGFKSMVFTTDNLPQLLPQIRSGRLRALAVTSPARWFQLPDVPTVGESGYPNMTTAAWFGLVAQSKTSREVIARMNRELVAILRQPDFVAKLREVSFEALPGTPEDLIAASRRERGNWKRVVEISGAKGE